MHMLRLLRFLRVLTVAVHTLHALFGAAFDVALLCCGLYLWTVLWFILLARVVSSLLA